MEDFLKNNKVFGYNWEHDYNKYTDVDGTPREEIIIYTPYTTPQSCERIEIFIEKSENDNNKYIASTEALSNAMFELLGEDEWLSNDYLIQIKSDLLKNVNSYNKLEECLNTVVYRFEKDKFDFYELNEMCSYCITIITMIMNYKTYNWRSHVCQKN